MSKSGKMFSKEDRLQIERALTSAANGSSGGVAAVVASISGTYHRAEDIFGLLFAIVCLASVWSFFPPMYLTSWGGTNASLDLLGIVTITVLAGFAIGAELATLFPILCLPFIPHKEKELEVQRRARDLFFSHHIRKTVSQPGVLIYVSLFERMVSVVGDDALNAKVGAEQWRSIHEMVSASMREGRHVPAFEKAIEKSGSLLAKHFPSTGASPGGMGKSFIVID